MNQSVDADRLARALATYLTWLRPGPMRFDDFITSRSDALDDLKTL